MIVGRRFRGIWQITTVGLGKYLTYAFRNRWNLLGLFGGAGLAFVSGAPDVVLPLVLAAEAGYLGFIATHPRFRKYVDAQEAQSARQRTSETNEQALKRILKSLPRQSVERFERLRRRCQELRQIAADLRSPTDPHLAAPLDSLQLQSLDRLLWIFLRLLFTHYSLDRFLQRTRVEPIQDDVRRLEKRLGQLSSQELTPHMEKIRRTLEDHLQTSRDRLANYEKAVANFEFVVLEIDRLENKIKSLAELAINRHEPDYISSQVDQVATSMRDTEQTMNELQFATGLSHLDDEPPEMLPEMIKH